MNMTNLKSENAYRFWCRVDELRGGRELMDVAAGSGIKYKSMLVQRSNTSYPKAPELVALANELGTTVEYLVVGKKNDNDEVVLKIQSDKRLYRIAKKLTISNDRHLCAVEVVLGLETEGFSSSNLA